MNFETRLHTSLNRDDLFAWQAAVLESQGTRAVVRVDTWTVRGHPAPDGTTFTLYACTIVLATIRPQARDHYD